MKLTDHPSLARLFGLGGMLLLCVLLTAGVGGAQETMGTYVNPVSKTFADTFADPSIIKAKDGYWAATRTAGKPWIWGGTWTLPADTKPRIGLISLGKVDPNDPSATARFDYFRVYRP